MPLEFFCCLLLICLFVYLLTCLFVASNGERENVESQRAEEEKEEWLYSLPPVRIYEYEYCTVQVAKGHLEFPSKSEVYDEYLGGPSLFLYE